jgi:hypothetical protein
VQYSDILAERSRILSSSRIARDVAISSTKGIDGSYAFPWTSRPFIVVKSLTFIFGVEALDGIASPSGASIVMFSNNEAMNDLDAS